MDNLLSGGEGRVVSVSSLAAIPPFLNLKDVNFVQRKWFRQTFTALRSFWSYGASKRANLLFTNGLHRRFQDRGIQAVAAHPGYSRTSIALSGWTAFAPMFVRKIAVANTIGSMSSDYGAKSQLRAALDSNNVKNDAYVGPLFGTVGRPVVLGTSMQYYHHSLWPSDEKAADELWKWSEERLDISFE